MTVYGHHAARLILERNLPNATLLTGPPSIGKWTLGQHLAAHHHVATVDRWLLPDGLSTDAVRLVTAFAHRAPVGVFKLIQVRLDGSSTPAQNALLKTLEEPPRRVRFLLTSSSDKILPTVASRCQVFTLGLLHTDDLIRIYTANGMSPGRAQKAAQLAKGRVAAGYDVDNNENPKSVVLNLAKAIAVADRDLFDTVFKTWDARTTELLATLLTECLTRRWSVFAETDAAGLHNDRPRLLRMVGALSRLPAARPRLGVRAALEPFAGRS